MKEKLIILKNQKGIIQLDINEIIAITCEGYCTTFHYGEDEKRFTYCKSLHQIEEELLNDVENWLRINRNSIIFIEKVLFLNKQNRILSLKGGIELQISVRNLSLFNKMLDK